MTRTQPPDAAVVRTFLGRVALRLWCRRVGLRFLRATAVATVGVAVAILGARMILERDLRSAHLLGILALGLTLAMIPALRRVTIVQTARVADMTFGLGERCVTAVECLGQDAGAQRLVVRDAARSCLQLDLRRVQMAPAARDVWWAAMGIVALTLLWLQPAVPSAIPEAAVGIGTEVQDSASRTAGSSPAGQKPEAGATGDPQAPGGGLRRLLALNAGDPAMPTQKRGGAASEASDTRVRPDSTTARQLGGSQETELQSISGTPGSRESAGTAGSPVREGPAPGKESVGRGSGQETPGRETPAGGVALGTDAPGADMQQMPDARRRRGAPTSERASTWPEVSRQEEHAVFARSPVPPALRQYILRYFQQLHRTPHEGGRS